MNFQMEIAALNLKLDLIGSELIVQENIKRDAEKEIKRLVKLFQDHKSAREKLQVAEEALGDLESP